MNDNDLARFLVRVTIADNRQVDELVMAHWRECLEGLQYDDCIQALVEHCKESTDYLKPAHIVERAREIRRQRLKGLKRRVEQKLSTYTEEWRYMPIDWDRFTEAVDDDEKFSAAVKEWCNSLVSNFGYREEDLRMVTR